MLANRLGAHATTDTGQSRADLPAASGDETLRRAFHELKVIAAAVDDLEEAHDLALVHRDLAFRLPDVHAGLLAQDLQSALADVLRAPLGDDRGEVTGRSWMLCCVLFDDGEIDKVQVLADGLDVHRRGGQYGVLQLADEL